MKMHPSPNRVTASMLLALLGNAIFQHPNICGAFKCFLGGLKVRLGSQQGMISSTIIEQTLCISCMMLFMINQMQLVEAGVHPHSDMVTLVLELSVRDKENKLGTEFHKQ